MKKVILILTICLLIMISGCIDRGDLKITPVMKGQLAPHDGYNIGPELYLIEGEQVIVSGWILWLKGTEPIVLMKKDLKQ